MYLGKFFFVSDPAMNLQFGAFQNFQFPFFPPSNFKSDERNVLGTQRMQMAGSYLSEEQMKNYNMNANRNLPMSQHLNLNRNVNMPMNTERFSNYQYDGMGLGLFYSFFCKLNEEN